MLNSSQKLHQDIQYQNHEQSQGCTADQRNNFEARPCDLELPLAGRGKKHEPGHDEKFSRIGHR